MNDLEQFYPTPAEACDRMLARYSKESGHYDRDYNLSSHLAGPFLDPHGGNGNLLDALVARGVKPQECFTYEINPNRQATLRGKNYRVLGADFLKDWDEALSFPTWLINPPWRQDAKHILAALERFRGGHLIALMSTDNYLEPRTGEEQSLVKKIEYLITKGQADVEHWGPIFQNAERPTMAGCTCIWIELPVEQIFDPSKFKLDDVLENEDYVENGLVNRKYVPAMVSRYNAARQGLLDRHEAQAKLNFYMTGIASPYIKEEVRGANERESQHKITTRYSAQDELIAMKLCFWYTVYEQLSVAERAPSSFKEQFDKFSYQNAQLAFTEENILQVILTFVENADELMLESATKMFDRLTQFSPKNTKEVKTWKTNRAFQVKSKVIIPGLVTYESRWGGSWSNKTYTCSFMSDLDKIWCYLSGTKSEDVKGSNSAYGVLDQLAASKIGYGEAHESYFFIIQAYKTGTVHIQFKDPELLKKFNLVAAKSKKWIDSVEAESCADQREREAARKSADHVTVTHPGQPEPAPTDSDRQLALI